MNTENQNQRQRDFRTGTVIKYYQCISEMNQKMAQGPINNIQQICNHFNISKRIPAILQEQKIVRKLSKRNYIWIGKKPSIDMAEKILEISRIKSLNYSKGIKAKGQREIQFEKPVVKILNPIKKEIKPEIKSEIKQEIKVEKQNYTFSILWGLIKIQKS